jgi:hypothetical protein
VLDVVDRAAVAYRSRQRMPDDTLLMLVLPTWAKQMMRSDITRQSFLDGADEFAISDAQIDAMFVARNGSPVWSLDWPSAEWAAQTDGYLDGWPASVDALLFHPSTRLYLDGGQLNIGIVRDATLVGTNDFIMFSEFLETLRFTASNRFISRCNSA